MKKYIHIVLSLLIVVILGACEDSLGTDPDYKTTIVERDTLFRIDTIVRIDTVKSSDSTEYIFTIDSMIVVRDSLGNVIDSLTQLIRDIDTRNIAPRFSPILDSVITVVTYRTTDTLYNNRQEEVYVTTDRIASRQPLQRNFDYFTLEMDTNLSKNWAWLDCTFDGQINLIDSNDLQMVFLSNANIILDSVQTFNTYSLRARQGTENYSYTSSIIDIKDNNITLQSNQIVTAKFLNYKFDNQNRINGFDIQIEFDLEARNVQFVNKRANYKFLLSYRYP